MKAVTGLLATAALAVVFLSPATGPARAQTKGDPAKGKVVYTELRCNLCHKVADAGGAMGPALDKVADTRDAEWLAKYLPDPKSVDPANKMPPAKATGEDLDNLIAYLLTLKSSH